MKKLKRMLGLVLILAATVLLNNTKSFAAETEYSDNVIPVMTSDTSPIGVASASSVYNNSTVNFREWIAFDHNNVVGWVSNSQSGWLGYEFTVAKCIKKYTIVSRKDGYGISELPRSWTFEAWDNNLNKWVVLDMHSNVTNWIIDQKSEFVFENNTYYNKYRINISENNGESFIAIGEMEMMESKKETIEQKLKVVLGPKEKLQLSVDDDLEENVKLTWTSSDNSIATVDANGEVTAIKAGNSIIMVTSADGTYTDVTNVLVVNNPNEYRLAVDLRVGKSCRLTIDDYTNTIPVTWTSMDPTVATISPKGKIIAVSKGLTLMIATDSTGKEIGRIYVRVRI